MDSLLIDNNGVEVSFRENMGRIVIANKDLNEIFGVIVREMPAIVWDVVPSQQLVGYQNFFRAFRGLSSELKDQLLQLFHPPLDGDSHIIKVLKPIAQQLSLINNEYDEAAILKLLAILASNAHQYYGSDIESADNLRQYESMVGSTYDGKLALYLFGSKVQHSCNPNATYSSKTSDGALEYKVVRPIKAGDEVSFSYIGDLFHTPTFLRREKLNREKDFFCTCDRCCGPDYCRIAKCPECGELAPTQSSLFSGMWKCVTGCTPSLVNETIERNYNDHLINMKSKMSAETPTQQLYELIIGATMELSPTHFICIHGLLELATLYASKAAEKEASTQFNSIATSAVMRRVSKISELPINELRQKAALYGLKAISLIECVAANCKGCKYGSMKHAPVYESAARIFHVCIDLIDLHPTEYPIGAKNMIRRYVPLMKATFGEDDEDVKKIESMILSADTSSGLGLQCNYCKKVTSKLLVCSRCYLCRYCGKECQVNHWKTLHKSQCIPCE